MSAHECPQCGGMFVETAMFTMICTDQQTQADVLAMNIPPAPPAGDHVKYLKCPQCQHMMNRCNFAHHSGVILDVCKSHGFWMQHDGLRRIVEFIRGGGLERAQRAEAEEKKRHEAMQKLDRVKVFHDDGIDSRYW